MAAKGSVEEVQQVQVDGLVRTLRYYSLRYVNWVQILLHPPHAHTRIHVQVVLKIIKHCQEEGSGSELVTGCLVGVVVGTTLEVTNCFPLPKDFENPQEESECVSSSSYPFTQLTP